MVIVLFPHTVEAFTTERRTDADGNVVRWARTDGGVPVPAFVQADTTTPTDAGPGQRAAETLTVYLSRFVPAGFDSWSAIGWDGARWDVIAGPEDHRSLSGDLRYVKVRVQRT